VARISVFTRKFIEEFWWVNHPEEASKRKLLKDTITNLKTSDDETLTIEDIKKKLLSARKAAQEAAQDIAKDIAKEEEFQMSLTKAEEEIFDQVIKAEQARLSELERDSNEVEALMASYDEKYGPANDHEDYDDGATCDLYDRGRQKIYREPIKSLIENSTVVE